MSQKNQIIQRFLEFGKNLFGKEYGWKKKYAEALQMMPQSLEKIIQREAIGGIIQQRLRELGADVDYIMTGEKGEEKHRSCTSEEENMLKRLREIGIDTKEKLDQYLSPENLAADMALVLRERMAQYKIRRRKK